MPRDKVHRKQNHPGKKEKAPKLSRYMTRSKAIAKLNATMDQFRKLCILKGIYPRLPTKHVKGMNLKQTYYHVDDIKALVHDKVLSKIKQIRAYGKHVRKLDARKEYKTKKVLSKNKPVIDLASTIQQRYPTFSDALVELGDCLSMVQMFASYRASVGEKADAVRLSRRISMEWDAYVRHTKSLKKCFISHKGYYYTAMVCGIPVNWMVPHQFSIEKNEAVDFKVLHDFLSFYVVLMKFVNYKLYTSVGLVYPPKITIINGVEYVGDVVLQRIQLKDNQQQVTTTDIEVAELDDALKNLGGSEDNIATELPTNELNKQNNEVDNTNEINANQLAQNSTAALFSGLVFYLQREVPRKAVGFVIEALDGEIVDDVDNERITHQIGERGEHKSIEREYVYPQWLFDCVNENFLLPCGEYTIGSELPPHLSPYVNEEQEGYVTERRKQLNAIKNNTTFEEEKEEGVEEEGVIENDLEKDFANGLAEELGKKIKTKKVVNKPRKTKAEKEEELEKQRKMATLTSKERRIVRNNERVERTKAKKVQKLKKRLEDSKH
ncbi:Pescadillo-like protein [Entamoeba marina]